MCFFLGSPLAQVLAADDVGEEHLADRRPRRPRGQHPDPRDHVVGEHVRDRAEDGADLVARVDVAGHDGRAAPAAVLQPLGRAQDRLVVAAVGAAGEQYDVGRVRGEVEVVPLGDRTDRDHLAAAGERDPAAGLRGDQLLVADHGDPEPAAGAGAGQHLGVRRPRVGACELGQAHVVPVEDVGVDGGAVLRARDDRTRGQVDEQDLGERRAEVGADRELAPRMLSQVPGRGRPAGRRRSRCRR